ncbi:MAG TPA: RHS repeat-associated core domain-containing protein, partial [Bacteroidales bacterium]|nr:RHS repeat-associated core domain-containing protein [Bacteroidales bacterium]
MQTKNYYFASYTYFGSKYYDSELSAWLSVDPMSDKYPSLSPYCYSADNPVVLKDPNGEEIRIYY